VSASTSSSSHQQREGSNRNSSSSSSTTAPPISQSHHQPSKSRLLINQSINDDNIDDRNVSNEINLHQMKVSHQEPSMLVMSASSAHQHHHHHHTNHHQRFGMPDGDTETNGNQFEKSNECRLKSDDSGMITIVTINNSSENSIV